MQMTRPYWWACAHFQQGVFKGTYSGCVMLEQVLACWNKSCQMLRLLVEVQVHKLRPSIALDCVNLSCILLNCIKCSSGHAGAMRISILATAMFLYSEWLERRYVEASMYTQLLFKPTKSN